MSPIPGVRSPFLALEGRDRFVERREDAKYFVESGENQWARSHGTVGDDAKP